LQAIIHYGVACASLNYHPGDGVPLAAHIYLRALGAAWTRYRQEWAYYLHFSSECGTFTEQIPMPPEHNHFDDAMPERLGLAMNQLPDADQLLLRQLYWDGARQKRIAIDLHISQQEVSRRKSCALRRLRRILNCKAGLFSRLLPLWWGALDSLDLLPGIDLL